LLQKKLLHLESDFTKLSGDAAGGVNVCLGKSVGGCAGKGLPVKLVGAKKSKKMFDLIFRAVI
jgi:hypothetical protein